jgi:hypothetical protein
MTRQRRRSKGPGSRKPRRVITNQVGVWQWNTDNLHKRIVKSNPDECWTWLGSKNKHGNIFGAYKNGRQQMTQANRILYMEQTNQPIDDVHVRMTCHNPWCSNPNHFSIRPYRRTAKKLQPETKMLIKETLHTEGWNAAAQQLTYRLKEFHKDSSFDSGIDWGTQTMWATMTKEQCVVFCLKYPEYADRFTEYGTDN